MNYRVAEIETPDGIYYTSRNNDRAPLKVVQDGINGYNRGNHSPIYSSLARHRVCLVRNIFEGLDKKQAESKKRVLIELARSKGVPVLNRRQG